MTPEDDKLVTAYVESPELRALIEEIRKSLIAYEQAKADAATASERAQDAHISMMDVSGRVSRAHSAFGKYMERISLSSGR